MDEKQEKTSTRDKVYPREVSRGVCSKLQTPPARTIPVTGEMGRLSFPVHQPLPPPLSYLRIDWLLAHTRAKR